MIHAGRPGYRPNPILGHLTDSEGPQPMDIERLHDHTEELIGWIADHTDGDDALAAALPWWARTGHTSRDQWADLISGYRRGVAWIREVHDDPSWPRWARMQDRAYVRFMAWLIRFHARPYRRRWGFDPAWLKAPR